MSKARQLFYDRKARNDKEVAYYSKFIFNGHFIVFLTIAFGALMLQYSQLLKNLPDNVNYNLIIAVILATLTVTPLRTFMKSADSVFLLNFERDMPTYFKYAVMRSGRLRTLLFIVTGGILVPLYMERTASVTGFICAIVLGVWMIYSGLIMRHLMMTLGITNGYISLLIFLMALSGIYTALEGLPVTIISIILFTISLIYLLNKNAAHRLLNFDYYIDYEHQLNQAQNKLINMFTDVKVLNERTVRRRYLDVFLKVPSPKKFNQNYMYKFLFVRSFARGKDAFFIVLRLLIIGLVLIWWIDQPVISAILGALIMYLLILQLSQFYKQQAYGLWPQVWPVSEGQVVKGYHQFLINIMIVLGIILSIIYILKFVTAIYFVILFFIVGWLTIDSSIKKIKKHQELLRD